MLDYSRSFIETQFPVSKISKESYKERKAGQGQTLTGLGKWWGRKPLILVRASIIGTLLPVSENLKKDKAIFLKIMMMDDEGLYNRKDKNISKKDLWKLLSNEERTLYFREGSTTKKPKYPTGMDRDKKKSMKEELQKLAFNRLSYDDKLSYCLRPEEIELVNKKTWEEINSHLETNAQNLQELIKELGNKRFGHTPKVGDVFSGGGSIPFEAGRIGAETFGSDLNPVASMLTWANLNILGSSDEKIEKLKDFRKKVYDKVDKQIKVWGIELNEKGHRADSYLYCVETTCPECGFEVPLAPSWTISKSDKTIALLEKDIENKRFDISIIEKASKLERSKAKNRITVKKGNLVCPKCERKTPISTIRGDKRINGKTEYGLELWESDKFIHNHDDTFKERLYAIRYINEESKRYFTAPTNKDLKNEEKIIKLLEERFFEWQEKGYIPNEKIKPGEKTDEPIRTQGWQYWHQLFNPRQLLINGLFAKYVDELAKRQEEYVLGLLGVNRIINYNSKLARWNSSYAKAQETFYNQALNTLSNYNSRSIIYLQSTWFFDINNNEFYNKNEVHLKDARNVDIKADIWITDPPYADAVNYHELTEFFLAWDKKILKKAFPEWYTESKRLLAVKGTGKSFNESMIDIYKNLAKHMPDNGYQVVMFTHQDVKVWSELTMILWSAGLKVSAAWNIATETESAGLKVGNYVKGTVLLVLQKQTSGKKVYQNKLYNKIKHEVIKIIDSMKQVDSKDNPDFTDADYLLASNAAALKVMTSYKEIKGLDVRYWLSKERQQENPIERLIHQAREIANEYLIPDGFEKNHWFSLSEVERFYLRAFEMQLKNENTIGGFQELARGLGINDYKLYFQKFDANDVSIKSPIDFKTNLLTEKVIDNSNEFKSTLLRHVLMAIKETTQSEKTSIGLSYLKRVLDNYWQKKEVIKEILDFISKAEYVDHLEQWHNISQYSKYLREALNNEGV